MSLFPAFLVLLSSFAAPAIDALGHDEAVLRTQGATIRLVAAPPDGEGDIRGAVLFDLEPGWKTYWQDPGEAGLAPRFAFRDLDGGAQTRFLFPVPGRFEEAGLPIVGYDAPVAIAFTIDGVSRGELELDLLVGLCRDICVPVTGRLRVDTAGPADAGDLSWIDRAFLALPDPAPLPLSATIADSELVITGPPELLAQARDVFVSGDAWSFGTPRNEGLVWRVPVRQGQDTSGPLPSLYAIIDDGRLGRRTEIQPE